MNDKMRQVMIILFVAVYAIAPDFFPGPIDDIIVIMLGTIKAKQISSRKIA